MVTRNLPPLRGGMERLNQHVAIELGQSFRLCVIGPVGSREFLPHGIEVHEIPVRPLWRFLPLAMIHAMRLSYRYRPGLLYAGSGLTAPMVVIGAWLAGGRSAVYVHGLDLVTSHWLYRTVWLRFLANCDLCLVNSRHTRALAIRAGLKAERIDIIHPGVALPDESGPEFGYAFRRQYQLIGRKMLLSVGRLTPRKGLLEFVCCALPQVISEHPDAVLLVIGDEAPDALNGTGVGSSAKIMACASALGLAEHVLILGACTDAELSAAYEAADLCIFPLVDVPGDVEGFGMVAIEAAAHGLPTVAFEVGGVADAIADEKSGWLVPAGDYRQLVKRISQVLIEQRTPEIRRRARDFARTFEWSRFGVQLRHRLKSLLSGQVTRS